ncbi:ABC transporter ATP-binding protein [Streptomyces ipomoeae]|jgi:putative ABC transport system ATP-binding protein|uniref:ABC transporter ATP-binding protein n=2 Tax=Streptomyces ipomoeae TaxID=103232 RepID=UPI0015F0C60E|nr:ABC transporter ATP-binding protein [Streptomyces ipomoeae]MDX2938291.1 ABC transporter ATP-binding protein [Streptomyces ipomoeae]
MTRPTPDGGPALELRGPALTPVLELRGAALTYPGPPPVEALKPCDLRVGRGEYVTVVGPSGSGKSTFLNIAGLLDTPTAGVCLLDGHDTGALKDAERTALRGRRIGFVFQSFHLLPHRSARENVELAMMYGGRLRRAARAARAREALERVGLGPRADAPPTRLSGGERQRVAIARALVARPSLLLCDEPTGSLDSATAKSVLRLLDALHDDGMTLVVITHDPAVAARGQRTVTIRDGVLSERSEPGRPERGAV